MARMSSSELKANAIVYTYPSGDVDIICASDKSFMAPGWEEVGAEPPQRAKREKGKKSDGEDRERSMRRARANLRRLALANDFDYFVTLTLDPAKVDRYDPAAVTKKLNQWCDNMVRRHGLRYVLVPELHRDGAFHFHGFFAGRGLKVEDSGHSRGGDCVFNLPQWSLGFSTAQRLRGEYAAAVAYCCKYVGKQEGQRPLGRWYYSGGALQEPRKEYVTLDYRELQSCGQAVEFEIPGSKMLVIHTKMEE